MSMRRNPNLGNEEARSAFMDQTAADEKKRLHCLIPATLHQQFRQIAFDEDTDITNLVIQAMQNYLADRGA